MENKTPLKVGDTIQWNHPQYKEKHEIIRINEYIHYKVLESPNARYINNTYYMEPVKYYESYAKKI